MEDDYEKILTYYRNKKKAIDHCIKKLNDVDLGLDHIILNLNDEKNQLIDQLSSLKKFMKE